MTKRPETMQVELTAESTTDRRAYEAGVVLLGLTVLSVIIGAVVLAATDHTIPDPVTGLGLMALTGLTALLRPGGGQPPTGT